MKAIILTEDTVQQLFERLKAMEIALQQHNTQDKVQCYDNEQLMKKLNVSKRTLQYWRDCGIITFSQIGHKIYYTQADIDKMLKYHLQPAFNAA